MTSTIERLPGLPVLSAPPDWAEASFPAMDTVPETHGIHGEERLTDGTYVLLAELPGVDAEDIEITIRGGVLTLRAERSAVTAEKQFVYGHYTPLPTGAKGDEATAQHQHGVVTITMPVLETGPGTRVAPVREPLSVAVP
ncbi:Hsp20/alpha crystallin family protein [Streptomyces purpurascens]|uniref:Hsp20/alpha crystallin family protein n=1 Tax=Streptomyces purpurascens TaxID=1924 RepID=UPI001675ECD8|nr:Hsp20/alpha crystallin family protein [Streptomyces purpurascens]MCE7051634.1 Hsp20/alpha crystallin family protein [Streptomyces purpurascens]